MQEADEERDDGAVSGCRPGQLVRDGEGRTGRLMDEVGGRLFLRPPGGGREWSVDPAEVEPVPEPSAADALRVRLREINVRSRRGRSGDASG